MTLTDLSTGSSRSNESCGTPPAENRPITPEAFEDAYRNGFGRTARFMMSKGISVDRAEELAQIAWTKGWERRRQLRNPAVIATWINKIALNTLRNRLRSPLHEELPDGGKKIPLGPVDTISMGIDARRILAGCKEYDRSILREHYLEGYGSREIAKRNGSTAGAIRVRLLRARRHLREQFGASRISSSGRGDWGGQGDG
jgi:RNA polymerase sigma-70 factor (ECF subfamily)